MNSQNQKLLIGVIIIFIGIMLLLDNYNFFGIDGGIWWGLGLMALGAFLLNNYRQNREKKGTLWIGTVFVVFGLLSILNATGLFPNEIIGTFFLWGIAALFISSYIRDNDRWWTIIPGGIFLVLGCIVLIDAFNLLSDDLNGFIFLFGLSLVFWFLYLINDEKNKLSWAGIVAPILSVFSFFVLTDIWDNQLSDILFPLSIIFCGVYLIFRGLKK